MRIIVDQKDGARDIHHRLVCGLGYQYTPEGPGAILVNASLIHEKQQLNATFNAGGSDNATNHLAGGNCPRRRRAARANSLMCGGCDFGDTSDSCFCPGSARCRFEALSSPP